MSFAGMESSMSSSLIKTSDGGVGWIMGLSLAATLSLIVNWWWSRVINKRPKAAKAANNNQNNQDRSLHLNGNTTDSSNSNNNKSSNNNNNNKDDATTSKDELEELEPRQQITDGNQKIGEESGPDRTRDTNKTDDKTLGDKDTIDTKPNEEKIDSSSQKDIMTTTTNTTTIPNVPDLGKAFDAVAEKMRQQTTLPLSTTDKLMLYGLYKQASEGNAPDMCWSVSMADQSKHHSWAQFRDMPKEVAALQYIEHAMKLLHSSAGSDGAGGSSATDATMQAFGAGVTSRPMGTEDEQMDKKDMTPEQLLLVAAGEDDVETLRVLLQGKDSKKVNVDTTDEGGQTAMHMAADAGSLHALQILLEHGGNAKAADQYGISVLQAAVISGNVAACKLLLAHGADPDQTDDDGDTPRNCAVDDGGKEMRLLFRIGGNAMDESIQEEDGDDDEEGQEEQDETDFDDMDDDMDGGIGLHTSATSWDTAEDGFSLGTGTSQQPKLRFVFDTLPSHISEEMSADIALELD